MKAIKERLQGYQLIDSSFKNFEQLDYHRDFALYFEVPGANNLKIILIGVVSVNYSSRIILANFNLDNKLLIENMEPPYSGYHWGIRGFGITNWKVEDDTDDLKSIQNNYSFKLNKISFEVSSANISFIFHDLDIKELK